MMIASYLIDLATVQTRMDRHQDAATLLRRALSMRETVSGPNGLDLVDTLSQLALSPEQQDEILAAVESGKAQGWPRGDMKAGEFFTAVRAHTLIGFLADPKYGGNRDYAGWKVAGYPGGGHHLGGYSPAQLNGKEKIKTIWGEEV
jgi:hypothetical protein